MEQIQEIFVREYDTGFLPDLQTGIGGGFTAGLQFVCDPSFVAAVAAAAKQSVVCNESSVRGFLYHLPNLIHEIAERLRPQQLSTQTPVVLRGDADTGLVIVDGYSVIYLHCIL